MGRFEKMIFLCTCMRMTKDVAVAASGVDLLPLSLLRRMSTSSSPFSSGIPRDFAGGGTTHVQRCNMASVLGKLAILSSKEVMANSQCRLALRSDMADRCQERRLRL